jgi:TolA-binding protein
MMRRVTLSALTLFMLLGCSDPAAEIYETAQFEELQFNKPHAVELYQRIVKDYPDSPLAAKATQRLKALEAD